MDFHALSRRELQALCKRNAVRANMTNAAMAEALQGLPSVDGIDELKETVSVPSRHAKSAAPGRGASVQPASATVAPTPVALRRSQRKAAWKAAGPAEAEQQSVVHVSAAKRTARSAMSRMAMALAESSDGAIGSAVEDVAVVREEQRTKPQEDETSEENDLTEAKEAAAHDTPQAELIDDEASKDNLDEDEEDDEASEDNLDEDEEDDEASEDNLDEGEEWASNDDRAAEETDYIDGSDKENTEGIQEDEELNRPEEVRAKELQKQLHKDLHGVSLSKFRATYKELLAAEAAEGKMLSPAEVDYNACVIS